MLTEHIAQTASKRSVCGCSSHELSSNHSLRQTTGALAETEDASPSGGEFQRATAVVSGFHLRSPLWISLVTTDEELFIHSPVFCKHPNCAAMRETKETCAYDCQVGANQQGLGTELLRRRDRTCLSCSAAAAAATAVREVLTIGKGRCIEPRKDYVAVNKR
ncbi:uncharacterized protein V6R79_006133 [Siganus canaliculatus]